MIVFLLLFLFSICPDLFAYCCSFPMFSIYFAMHFLVCKFRLSFVCFSKYQVYVPFELAIMLWFPFDVSFVCFVILSLFLLRYIVCVSLSFVSVHVECSSDVVVLVLFG